MWQSVVGLSDYINESNEVVSVRVCQTLLSLISRYSAKFSQNGVKMADQEKIIDDIKKQVFMKNEIRYSNNYAKSIARTFDIEAVRLKLEMAYAD